MTDETTTRTLEVRTRDDGVFRIEIPVAWKCTFSKVNPQAGGYECMALRVYENEDKQRACFTNVVSFRDLSIPFTRRVKKGTTQTVVENSPRKRSRKVEADIDFEWIGDDEFDDSPAF